MRIWILTVGEPLPVDGPHERLMRSALLTEELARRGHEVTFFSSAFDHVRKSWRADETKTMRIEEPGYDLVLLRGLGYQRNVSLQRFRDHRAVAREFARIAPQLPRPDVILVSIPIVELATEALKLGVPVALDSRDLWPDIFVDVVPGFAKPLARLALGKLDRETNAAFRQADACLGHTRPFVDWGLSRAGRQGSELDRDFPFGYRPMTLDEPALAQATEWWAAQGVTSDRAVRMCFFGAVGHQFAFDAVVQSLTALDPNDRRDLQVVLCGDGESRPELERAAKDLGDGSLVVPGWVDRPQIAALMKLSHVGLAPYRDEPMFRASIPNKVIEYWSGGLPVLWSIPEGLVADLLRESGAGAVYRNAGEMVDGARSLATDSASSQAASTLFAERFEADRVYGDFADHIEKIARKS